MAVPKVTIVVADNGSNAALELPQQQVQVAMGCSVSGPELVPFASTDPATIKSVLGGGPLCEYAGMACAAGATVIAVRLPLATPGTATSVVATDDNGSTSVVTVSLDGTYGAFDDFYVRFKCVADGTVGTAGIKAQLSLDAGKTFGPVISLGTATSLAIPNTGITLNFGVGTMKAGDFWSFSTTAMAPDTTGINAAFDALLASPFAVAGWGSSHGAFVSSAATVAALQLKLRAARDQYVYSRMITTARDAHAPAAWGGSGETTVAWETALTTAFGSTNADCVVVGAGFYNMPSPYPNTLAGTPSYRRPLAWADAVRRTQIPPQRRGGRVKDGSLINIVVDPSSDPGDGFIYYDSRKSPTLDAARFLTAITWPKKQGFFVCHENLMAGVGSQFTDLTLGNVIDVACDIGYQEGVTEISDDLRITSAGTLYPTDALTLQNLINGALAANMTNVAMVSDAYSVVSQSANVGATNTIPIAISVLPRGYVDAITETINLATT